MIELASIDSPIGHLTIAAHDGRVCALSFGRKSGTLAAARYWYPEEPVTTSANPAGAVSALESYFAGELDALESVAVELNGTAFQRRVWERLRTVAAGTTASYAEVARAIGAPAAVRAVGAANGANPVALVVPCHRIIGSNGRLTGYGGGLDRKQWLLAHESRERRLGF